MICGKRHTITNWKLCEKTISFVDPSEKKKGKKFNFSLEVVKVPKNSLTKSTTKKFLLEQTFEQPSEPLDAIPKNIVPSDKDKDILELQEQLKKSHLVIAQLQHDNRELKKVSLERKINATTEEPMTNTKPYATKS